MNAMLATKLVAGGQSFEYLGRSLTHRGLYHLLRSGRLELLMKLFLPASGEPSFVRGRRLAVAYVTAAGEPLPRPMHEPVRQIALRLLKSEATALPMADAPPSPPAWFSRLNRDQPFALGLVGPGESAVEVVARHGTAVPAVSPSLSFFSWSLTWRGGQPLRSPEQAHAQQLLCDLVAWSTAASEGLGGPGAREEAVRQGRGRGGAERLAYLRLHLPAANDLALAALAPDGAERLRISVEVPSRCGLDCLFCTPDRELADRPEASPASVTAELDRLIVRLSERLPPGCRVEVVFVGQDALQSPAFPMLVQMVATGLPGCRVSLVTPGTRLAQPGLARELSRTGLSSVALTVLGPQAALHDRLTGRPGSFAELSRALGNLASAGLATEVQMVLLRDNLAALPELLEWALAQRRRLRIALYAAEADTPLEEVRRCAPPPAELAPAMEGSRERLLQLVDSLQGFPLCLLPSWARSLAHPAAPSRPDPALALPAACRACEALGNGCESLSQRYLEIFGDEALTALGANDGKRVQ